MSSSGRHGSAFHVAQREMAADAFSSARRIAVIGQVGIAVAYLDDGGVSVAVCILANGPDVRPSEVQKKLWAEEGARRKARRLSAGGAPSAGVLAAQLARESGCSFQAAGERYGVSDQAVSKAWRTLFGEKRGRAGVRLAPAEASS